MNTMYIIKKIVTEHLPSIPTHMQCSTAFTPSLLTHYLHDNHVHIVKFQYHQIKLQIHLSSIYISLCPPMVKEQVVLITFLSFYSNFHYLWANHYTKTSNTIDLRPILRVTTNWLCPLLDNINPDALFLTVLLAQKNQKDSIILINC